MKKSLLSNCTSFSRYANIKKCSWDGNDVIVKKFGKQNDFDHELDMYKTLQKNGSFIPGIVKMLGFEKKSLILEYIDSKPLPEDTASLQRIASDLLVSVKKMHDKGIVHKDLRFGANVIFNGARFVIIDFDAACRKGDDVCTPKMAMRYDSDLFDHVNGGDTTWDELAFLDLFYLCDELQDLFRYTPIGPRFDNIKYNIYASIKDITAATSKKSLNALLNTSEMKKALYKDTDFTHAIPQQPKFPYVSEQVFRTNDKDVLWEEVQFIRAFWVQFYGDENVLPLRAYKEASVQYLKACLKSLTSKDAQMIYKGEMPKEALLNEWPVHNVDRSKAGKEAATKHQTVKRPATVINPKTKRCIQVNGKVYKLLYAEGIRSFAPC